LCHREDGNRPVPMADEKRLEGLLGRLLGHEAGIRVITALLVAPGDGQIVLRLA
jgi:hypothetical protein